MFAAHASIVVSCHNIQGDDVKALLQDAVCFDPSVPSSSSAAQQGGSKSAVASKGLTAAGASLLANDYLDNEAGVDSRMGDGSDIPLRDRSGLILARYRISRVRVF